MTVSGDGRGVFYLFFSFPLLQFKVIVTRPGLSYGRVKTCVNRTGPRRAPEDITGKTDKSYGKSQLPISMTGEPYVCRYVPLLLLP